MRSLLFAANWKMHIGPEDARAYLKTFRARYNRRDDREVWFFPPAVSLEAAAQATRERQDLLVGAQDVYWEPKGAFTGAISATLALQAGARATLIGHSERRYVFGETDEDTRRKVSAALAAGLVPLLCVGETLAERDAGHTTAVVVRQLAGALGGLDAVALSRLVIAYEPVWAIGTGRNATPRDASLVHREIRGWVAQRGATRVRVLYGGSVNAKNAADLLAERELDGVLVGGASLDPDGWAQLVQSAAA
ncbi:MAG TPA: triose-phosphate isomerase [Gemmatimonadales bacterium]|nr:triose-phosphate isomerase [Gemmatimonadales bacterium]